MKKGLSFLPEVPPCLTCQSPPGGYGLPLPPLLWLVGVWGRPCTHMWLRWQVPAIFSFIPSAGGTPPGTSPPALQEALPPLPNTHMVPMPVTWLTCHLSLFSASLELKLGAGADAQTQRKAPVARDSVKRISTWANGQASAQGPSPFISGLHC